MFCAWQQAHSGVCMESREGRGGGSGLAIGGSVCRSRCRFFFFFLRKHTELALFGSPDPLVFRIDFVFTYVCFFFLRLTPSRRRPRPILFVSLRVLVYGAHSAPFLHCVLSSPSRLFLVLVLLCAPARYVLPDSPTPKHHRLNNHRSNGPNRKRTARSIEKRHVSPALIQIEAQVIAEATDKGLWGEDGGEMSVRASSNSRQASASILAAWRRLPSYNAAVVSRSKPPQKKNRTCKT